jgi:hypothetical protein
MSTWNVVIRPEKGAVKILVNDLEGDILRARLPKPPDHPRALLTLLEGLALWGGQPVHAAISAGALETAWSELGLFGGELWPVESLLVRFSFTPRLRRRRLAGLGDFRSLYAMRGGRS